MAERESGVAGADLLREMGGGRMQLEGRRMYAAAAIAWAELLLPSARARRWLEGEGGEVTWRCLKCCLSDSMMVWCSIDIAIPTGSQSVNVEV